MAVVIPRYFGTLHELNKFCIQIVGEPVIIPVDPEHDLIMIYDIVEGESESRRTIKLVGVEEIDRSEAVTYRGIYIRGSKLVKVLRFENEVEIEDIDLNNLIRVEGKPIIIPLPTREKYRFAIFEIVELEENVWKDLKTFIPSEKWWFNDK